jgi:molybdate transport system ATP-binding protein
LAELQAAEGSLRIVDAPAGDELYVAVDPRDITIYTSKPSGSAQNVFAGSIVEIEAEPPGGERVRIVLDTHPPLVAEVTAHAVQTLGLREGLHVYAGFKATAARAYR